MKVFLHGKSAVCAVKFGQLRIVLQTLMMQTCAVQPAQQLRPQPVFNVPWRFLDQQFLIT